MLLLFIPMQYAILSQRGLIALSGDDAHEFLQGLASNDVRPLGQGKAVYAALLSPQGKFLHDFFLYPHGDAILLDSDWARQPELLQRLKMYRLRSKVTIEEMPEWGVAAMFSSPIPSPAGGLGWGYTGSIIQDCPPPSLPPAGGGVYVDPRLPQLGWRMVGTLDSIEATCQKFEKADSDAYEHMRLELGVPDGGDMIPNKSLLMEFGFEDLHGVDFTKGCYVGQEVTARSKHRGQMRRFIYQVRADGDLPEMGTPVLLEGVAAGELRSHSGQLGLAQMKIAEVERAIPSGIKFVCGNVSLTASLPPWVAHAPKALAIGE